VVNIERKKLEQALEAMEYADACLKKQLTTKTKHEYAQDLLLGAGTAIKEALAEPAQEPVAKVVSTAPDRIWLDIGFDPQDEAEISFRELCDVTWSEDNASGYGIEYVRADTPPAAQPAQEPVAWFKHGPYDDGEPFLVVFEDPKDDDCYSPLGFIDTTPPQRPWVGLTDEEAQWLYDNCRTPSNLIDMVEAKLKEKNSG